MPTGMDWVIIIMMKTVNTMMIKKIKAMMTMSTMNLINFAGLITNHNF
jgi:hypothetical protein